MRFRIHKLWIITSVTFTTPKSVTLITETVCGLSWETFHSFSRVHFGAADASNLEVLKVPECLRLLDFVLAVILILTFKLVPVLWLVLSVAYSHKTTGSTVDYCSLPQNMHTRSLVKRKRRGYESKVLNACELISIDQCWTSGWCHLLLGVVDDLSRVCAASISLANRNLLRSLTGCETHSVSFRKLRQLGERLSSRKIVVRSPLTPQRASFEHFYSFEYQKKKSSGVAHHL